MNKAIDKVEKLSKDSKTQKSAYKPENEDFSQEIAQNLEEKYRDNNQEFRTKRAEKEYKKKSKNTSKEKIKAAKRQKREEFKAEKLRRKEERIARRDMLKHETKEERQARKRAQQKAKALKRENARQEKIKAREQKNSIKRQKLENKRALKEQKRKMAQQNRREKRSRGLGGWLAAVITLGCLTFVFATLFMLNMFNVINPLPMVNTTEAQQSYFSFGDYCANLETNLSKVLLSKDSRNQQKLLTLIQSQALLAEQDLSDLPIKQENKYYTSKFINQLADYSKYLNNRLIDGYSLENSDYENLNNLYKINQKLNKELMELNSKLGDSYDFSHILNEYDDNPILQSFTRLESGATEYPKLIYDGPFSDSLETQDTKNTKESISISRAEQLFNDYFKDFDIQNVEILGETQGKTTCYNFSADTSQGQIFASLAKENGSLIMFNHYKECDTENYSFDDCLSIAEKFLQNLGLKNMEKVWATQSNATVYINFCTELEGVIIYPEMVKITVCQERGIVSSFDGLTYYLNAKTRKIAEPKIGQKEAITGLSVDLDIQNIRLALVKSTPNIETLCYEVYGKKDGQEYYIYISCDTGHEIDIFKVVSTSKGNLLI